MSWKKSKFRLTGVAPLVVHNGQLADPMNYFAKEMKKISGKKKKTDADYERLSAGAKKAKEGNDAKAGVYCTKTPHIKYDGPATADELWEDKKFRLTAGVKNPSTRARVMRTRAKFDEWSCDVELEYNDEMCSEEKLKHWLEVAGEQVGAFDWRPKFGRFKVKKIEG
ncbi:MAG: hypothetical protein KW793_04995 [Candidatus Doudnabacteria bacterium]|nr:hypothetical protein [Candidatus Doudnabacteria bacterium]